MEDNTGNGAGSGSPCSSPSAARQSTTSQEPWNMAERGILIQLTGTEGEWDSLSDARLLFPLECDDEGPFISVSGEAPQPNVSPSSDNQGLRCSNFHVPLSPSSPSSLGDFCLPAPSFLSPNSNPAHSMGTPIAKPFVNLVKSLSTEVDSKEASLKAKPFLSLVKSISTEISRSNPEVSQSRSDSKLNLHLWRQFTQPKGYHGDSRTAPPSPSSHSPSEPKGSFFKVELEDTRRKFSEAVQEQFSMISKIMGDENSCTPKCQRPVGPCDSSRGVSESKTYRDPIASETPGRNARIMNADMLSKKTLPKLCLSSQHCGKINIRGRRSEMCTNDEAIQSKEPPQGLLGQLTSAQHSPPVPEKWLLALTVLTYGYFILPLPSYLSGLSFGLACGFLLGLLLMLLLVPQNPVQPHKSLAVDENIPPEIFALEHNDSSVQKGWVNQIHMYDPETHNPSLTRSVYATLEGSWLQLAYPSNNIPRWAAFGEQPYEAAFISSRRYQLANSKVFLWPSLLARKRLWNKKYPICIALAEGQEGAEEESTEEACEGEPGVDWQAAPSQHAQPTTLYLFGRTGREKEEWFQHFLRASMKSHSRCGSQSGVSPPCGSSESALVQCTDGPSRGSTEDIPSQLHMRDLAVSMKEKILLDYSNYMTHFIVPANASAVPSPCPSDDDSPTGQRKFICKRMESHSEAQTAWVNALIGRIFWDFLCEKYWADLVAWKIQKKLSKIRLPYFMNELTLTELDLGTCMPQVTNVTRPSLDQRGLWLQLDLLYVGSLQMTLETKMNLSRLGKDGGLEADSAAQPGGLATRSRLCALADSDEESSSAGSSDEEEVPPSDLQGHQGDRGTLSGSESHGGGRKSRKILRFVDKIAKSKYFQKATENEYIKKMMGEMCNTPLLLTVEVQELSGTLAINIPPPPTDRIWYSFCTPPSLDLRVRPKLGEWEVTLTHITEWIEKKLEDEFQKVFVMPNMDDIYLPLMNSAPTSAPKGEQTPAQPSCGTSEKLQDKPCQERPSEGE